MKRFSLLLASAMLATMSVFAQTKPAAPAFASYTLDDDKGWSVAGNDDQYYLYNVDAGLFLTSGNDWATRASVATNWPTSTIVSYEDLLQGKAEVKGLLWSISEQTKIMVDGKEYNCFAFEQSSAMSGTTAKNGYNVVDGLDGIWVDGGSDRPYNQWIVNDLGNNTFNLSYIIEDESGEKVKPEGWYGAQRLADGDTRTYIEDGPNTTWALVSASEYEKVLPQLNLYYVQVGLADLIAKAKEQGSTSAAEYETLVNDVNADRAEVIKAIEVIAPAILLGEAIKAAKAVDPSYNYTKFETLYNSTEATAAELNEATTLLKAITALKQDIDAAKAKYSAIDLSEPIAVYNNLDATLEEITAAQAKVAEIVSLYEQSQADLEHPADITSTIPYVTDLAAIAAGNGTPPSHGWTSTKKEGNFHVNTWSVEGDSDGTNMTTPFLEYWKGAGNVLDDQIFYRDQEKDPFTVLPGAYRISSNIRLYNESGADYMTGAYLFANANRTNLVNPNVEGAGNEIEGAIYGNFNGMLYYWKDSFETYAIVPADGTLKFGVQTEGANFNWIATKNWKVEYLGAAYDALDYVRKNAELVAADYSNETVATKQLLTDFNAAKTAYTSATTADALLDAYSTLMTTSEELPANIAAWKAYEDLVAVVSDHNVLVNGSGEYVDRLEAYVSAGYAEAPNGDNEFPNGSYAYIIKAMELSTAEVEAETAFLTNLLDEAIKKSMVPGQDVSDMLVNPKFNDGFTGWTTKHENVYKSTNGGVNNVEAYSTVVDIYQTVTDVPDGIYSITCQAFERPALNADSYDGTEEPKVFLFMNDFQTGVMHIAKDAQDPATAVSAVSGQVTEGANCFLNENGEAAGWPYDLTFEGRYVPDSMEGASYAFQGGRYSQKVYGLVDGGTMKIGLTSNGVSAHWVLWANFTLTYEGKTAEAVNEVLESTLEQADNYMGENEDNMTTPALDALDVAISVAVKAQVGGDVDEMWDALISLNNAISDAKANVAALTELRTAIDNMEDAVNTAENPSTEAMNAYDEVSAKTEEDAILELTTEEVKALTEEVNKVADMLRIPAYEDASDENPVDMTAVIKNADFELNANNGDWTWNKFNSQNGPNKDGGIGGTKSAEFWNPNAAGLQFEIYQVLSLLPAGTYELTAKAGNAQKDTDAEGRAALYATTSGGLTASTPVDVTDSDDASGAAKDYSVIFTLKEGETVEIGFKSIGTMAAHWFICDDFRLTYYGTDSSKEVTEDEVLVDIDGIDADASAISAIYTITGAKVSSLQKGINIVKYANGKVAKVLVK